MDSKLQVFISSTYTDLIDERQAAVQSILKAGHFPAGMELFTAGDKSQWEVIQRWISDSDIYMIILGGRYGSIDTATGLSYTELEYDYAVNSDIPFFAVVIEEKALEEKVKDIGTGAIELENPEKMKVFREKVLTKMSSFYSDCKDVKIAVLETVPQLESDYKLKGWVRGIDIPDTKGYTDEINHLRSKNEQLNKKLEAKTLDKKTNSKQPVVDEEFSEIYEILNTNTIDIAGILKSKVPEVRSILSLALAVRDALMKGITNEIGMSDDEKFVFFTLCPKLHTYELVDNEKVTGVKYRRYVVTKKGIKFFAYVEKHLHKIKKEEKVKRQEEAIKSASPKKKAVKKKSSKKGTRKLFSN